jgi:outer membrane protein OmpA-like peptidoglycan-associated protein
LTALPVAASAQTRSAQDYVCALTDECEEQADAQATPRGNARSSNTRGFSLAKPAAKAAAKPAGQPARQASGAPTRPKQSTKMASASAPKRAAAERRVDLLLTFKLGSAELTDQAMAEAKVFAQALKLPALASRKFVIEGHTDAQGGREYNLDLSQRRARAVADYLSSLGVEPARFDVKGYGFDRPRPGRSASSADNRRVEAVLVS